MTVFVKVGDVTTIITVTFVRDFGPYNIIIYIFLLL